jgi:Tol biopolymer transport system component
LVANIDAMGRVLSLAAAVAAVLAIAASSSAASSGVIVFSATPEGSMTIQLFSVQASGDGLKQITSSGAEALDPSFSPNGKRIAFVRQGYGVYTMNPDGSALKRVTTGGRDAYPAWSPDGKSIAFVRPLGPAWKPFVVAAAGGKVRLLKQSPPAGRPSWTKAGLLIPSGGDILRIDPKTGKVLKYYGADVDAIWGLNTVTFSPSLSQLTYVGSRDPEPGDMECGEGPCQRFGLYIESLTVKKKKGKLIVKDTGPAIFSHDGKQIAYIAGGGLNIRSVGSGQTVTISTGTATPTTTSPPTWR